MRLNRFNYFFDVRWYGPIFLLMLTLKRWKLSIVIWFKNEMQLNLSSVCVRVWFILTLNICVHQQICDISFGRIKIGSFVVLVWLDSARIDSRAHDKQRSANQEASCCFGMRPVFQSTKKMSCSLFSFLVSLLVVCVVSVVVGVCVYLLFFFKNNSCRLKFSSRLSLVKWVMYVGMFFVTRPSCYHCISYRFNYHLCH